MTEKIEVEIILMMDADGYCAIGFDKDEAESQFEDNHGASTSPVRYVALKVRMAPAAVENGPAIDIPDTAGFTESMSIEAA